MACTMPIIVPVKLKMSASGASVMPSASSSLFTAPLRPSRIIHAKVRTRKLVQNGISTRSMSASRMRGPRRRQQVGDRVTREQREHRGPERDPQRDAQRAQIDRRGRRPHIVLGGQSAGLVQQAQPQDLRHGIQEERHDQQQQRVDWPGADPGCAAQRPPRPSAPGRIAAGRVQAGGVLGGRRGGTHADPSTMVWSLPHPTRIAVPDRGMAAPRSVNCFSDRTRSPGRAT